MFPGPSGLIAADRVGSGGMHLATRTVKSRIAKPREKPSIQLARHLLEAGKMLLHS
jgi:hypothetical protein